MKNISITLIIAVLFASCKPEPSQPVSYFKLINKSQYTINLKDYFNGKFTDYHLQTDDKEELERYGLRGGEIELEPPFDDSIVVTFNDTISIVHKRFDNNTKRSPFLNESYTPVGDGDPKYQFEYIFTEEDYQEALSLQK